MNYKSTREEQETHATFDAVTRQWHIWTNVPNHIKRMKEKLGYTASGRSDEIVFECYVPEKAIRFVRLDKPRREMTAEQLERQRNQLAKVNEAKRHKARLEENAEGMGGE